MLDHNNKFEHSCNLFARLSTAITGIGRSYMLIDYEVKELISYLKFFRILLVKVHYSECFFSTSTVLASVNLIKQDAFEPKHTPLPSDALVSYMKR